jgi:hypothetical protein
MANAANVNDISWLQEAGANVEITNYGVEVTGRTASWNGLTLTLAGLDLSTGEYRLVVTGYAHAYECDSCELDELCDDCGDVLYYCDDDDCYNGDGSDPNELCDDCLDAVAGCEDCDWNVCSDDDEFNTILGFAYGDTASAMNENPTSGADDVGSFTLTLYFYGGDVLYIRIRSSWGTGSMADFTITSIRLVPVA